MNIPKVPCDCGSTDWRLSQLKHQHICLECGSPVPFDEFVETIMKLMEEGSDD